MTDIDVSKIKPGDTAHPYPPDLLDEEDDNGTMPDNVESLAEEVVGHRIVSVVRKKVKASYFTTGEELTLTLDNGKVVKIQDTSDCCAYTELESFLLHPERVDHIITGVSTTDGYTKWHIYADMGDVLELQVGWSSGNPFYYGYGFEIVVEDINNDRH